MRFLNYVYRFVQCFYVVIVILEHCYFYIRFHWARLAHSFHISGCSEAIGVEREMEETMGVSVR